MRKLHLLALSIGLGFGSIAMAEPAVTMYGILDGGVTVSKLQHLRRSGIFHLVLNDRQYVRSLLFDRPLQ